MDLECRRPGFDHWVGKIPWRKAWQPTPVFLPGESHRQRSLARYSSGGRRESDTTERPTLSPSPPLHGGECSANSWPHAPTCRGGCGQVRLATMGTLLNASNSLLLDTPPDTQDPKACPQKTMHLTDTGLGAYLQADMEIHKQGLLLK